MTELTEVIRLRTGYNNELLDYTKPGNVLTCLSDLRLSKKCYSAWSQPASNMTAIMIAESQART